MKYSKDQLEDLSMMDLATPKKPSRKYGGYRSIEEKRAYERVYRAKRREHFRTKNREYYKENSEKIIKRAAKWNKEHPERRKEIVNKTRGKGQRRSHEWLRIVKAQPCMDCGHTFPPECMDFDHVRGKKVGGIGQLITRALSIIKKEAQKCDLVCSNCHRIRTRQRRLGIATRLRIYLSGKMTGLPDEGRAFFAHYAKKYRDSGFTVISPPEMDEKYHPGEYRQCIQRDAVVLLDPLVDRIYLLPNWRDSRGATYERYAAELVGIPVYDAETGERITTRMKAIEVPDPNTMEDAHAE